MPARVSAVSLLLAAAGATCFGPRRPPLAQAPSPCRTLAASSTIRRVQTSQAFIDALAALSRHYHGSDTTFFGPVSAFYGTDLVARFCGNMQTLVSPTISPLAVVFFSAPYEPDNVLVKFGVSAEGVSFLNDTLDVPEVGELGAGLNLQAWNAFIHSQSDLVPLSDPGQALSYTCFVWSLASNSVSQSVCNWVPTLQVTRSDSDSYTVTDPEHKRPIRIKKDREVLELPDF